MNLVRLPTTLKTLIANCFVNSLSFPLKLLPEDLVQVGASFGPRFQDMDDSNIDNTRNGGGMLRNSLASVVFAFPSTLIGTWQSLATSTVFIHKFLLQLFILAKAIELGHDANCEASSNVKLTNK